jgi:hypothetical protein
MLASGGGEAERAKLLPPTLKAEAPATGAAAAVAVAAVASAAAAHCCKRAPLPASLPPPAWPCSKLSSKDDRSADTAPGCGADDNVATAAAGDAATAAGAAAVVDDPSETAAGVSAGDIFPLPLARLPFLADAPVCGVSAAACCVSAAACCMKSARAPTSEDAPVLPPPLLLPLLLLLPLEACCS